MRLACFISLALLATVSRAAQPVGANTRFELPAFPLPALVREGGAAVEVSTTRLLRELHRGGVRGSGNLETVDSEYGLLRSDSLGKLAGWLEGACKSVGFDIEKSRTLPYDGSVHARLLNMATGIATLQADGSKLAIPIGILVCERREKWGDLPGDGAKDAYVAFVTDEGVMVYDPPTRQLAKLSEFPNRDKIVRVRF